MSEWLDKQKKSSGNFLELLQERIEKAKLRRKLTTEDIKRLNRLERAAQKAEGCLICETKTHNGYHHTFTVWKDKTSMMKYRASPAHLKAMKVFSKIAFGKIYGYETNNIPTWSDALKGWNDYAGDY